MAMEGLLALACASLIVAADPAATAPSLPGKDPRAQSIAATLAVQAAMQQGREFLLHNDAKAAIDILERQLPLINGNASYLALLREAYKLQIRKLQMNHQPAEAKVYQDHLSILDPRAAGAGSAPVLSDPSAAPLPPAVVRGYREEVETPLHLAGADQQKRTAELFLRAEQAFASRKFQEANLLFEQASQSEGSLSEANKERWAYCKLGHVVEQLNQHSSAYAALEKEIQSALALAPRLNDYGQSLRHEIDQRRQGAGQDDRAEAIAVRHLGKNADGWAVAETTNFRIFHTQSAAFAEQAARVAERTRRSMQRKWFGRAGEDWNPKCDLFLHATGEDYHRATGAPPSSPGHSSFRIEDGLVIGRRIDLHCDDPNLLAAVLPHETTHTVLAGNFGRQGVPRWADEGMAVLTEPNDKINAHLGNLAHHRDNHELFPLRQLVEMKDYPDPRYIGSFYAQSVSLVQFLTTLQGPQVFTQFVRDGLSQGYETALRQHYRFRDFAELEQAWARHAFQDPRPEMGLAQGNR